MLQKGNDNRYRTVLQYFVNTDRNFKLSKLR